MEFSLFSILPSSFGTKYKIWAPIFSKLSYPINLLIFSLIEAKELICKSNLLVIDFDLDLLTCSSFNLFNSSKFKSKSFSIKISWVISIGKPNVSYNLNAILTSNNFDLVLLISSSKIFLPCSIVFENISSSSLIILETLLISISKINESFTTGTNLYKKVFWSIFNFLPA